MYAKCKCVNSLTASIKYGETGGDKNEETWKTQFDDVDIIANFNYGG